MREHESIDYTAIQARAKQQQFEYACRQFLGRYMPEDPRDCREFTLGLLCLFQHLMATAPPVYVVNPGELKL